MLHQGLPGADGKIGTSDDLASPITNYLGYEEKYQDTEFQNISQASENNQSTPFLARSVQTSNTVFSLMGESAYGQSVPRIAPWGGAWFCRAPGFGPKPRGYHSGQAQGPPDAAPDLLYEFAGGLTDDSGQLISFRSDNWDNGFHYYLAWENDLTVNLQVTVWIVFNAKTGEWWDIPTGLNESTTTYPGGPDWAATAMNDASSQATIGTVGGSTGGMAAGGSTGGMAAGGSTGIVITNVKLVSSGTGGSLGSSGGGGLGGSNPGNGVGGGGGSVCVDGVGPCSDKRIN
jgi:hypothetical protein